VAPILVAGLGNPGAEYEDTRHNVGFMVIRELCRRYRLRLRPGSGEFLAAGTEIGGAGVMLVQPMTYMNNSGLAVIQALERYDAEPRSLLVVVDDLAIPLGMLRFRAQGSDGGHNGLASIIAALRSEQFPRLRCGIGPTSPLPAEEYSAFVLSPFDENEQEGSTAMIGRAADGVVEFVTAGLETAMSKYNS